jgi:hypothetical protein
MEQNCYISEIALNVCRQENVNTCFNSEDTTSFVVYGDYATEESNQTGEVTIEVKRGYSYSSSS